MRPFIRKILTGHRVAGAIPVSPLARLKATLAFLRLGRKSGALLSLAVAMAIYTWFYQWEFALGVSIMVLVHELGHVAAAKRKGIPVTAPFFIPFLGALIMLKRNPRDAETEAYVAMGGPLVGTVGALVSYLLGLATGNPLFHAVAYVGFTLNLINLLPIHPLDGGRIASTVTRWLWAAGAVGGLAAAIHMRSVLFFLLWLLFVWDLFSKYVMHKGKTANYSFWGKLEVPFSVIPGDDWLLKPFRVNEPLPFRTYSRLDGTQWIDLEWEQAGVVRTVKMPEQGIVLAAVGLKVEYRWKQKPKKVVLRYRIDYEPHENETYYQVPRAVRWKYGIGYGALAIALLVLLDAVEAQLSYQGGFFHSLRK